MTVAYRFGANLRFTVGRQYVSDFIIFLFARRYAGAGTSDGHVSVSVCPSVRPSVCLSQVGLLSKRIDGLG